MNIFGKAKVVVKSSVHALLDKAIDMNDVGALEEIIRELEEAMDKQTTLTLQAEDRVDTLPAKIAKLREESTKQAKRAKLFKEDGDPSNDHLILPTARRAVQLGNEAKELETELAEAQENAASMRTLSESLTSKHDMMMDQLKRLRKAKEKRETMQGTLDAVTQVQSATEGVDADRFTGAVEREETAARVAQRKLTQAAGSVQKSDKELELEAQAAELLASL